jgi:hypothetical protein
VVSCNSFDLGPQSWIRQVNKTNYLEHVLDMANRFEHHYTRRFDNSGLIKPDGSEELTEDRTRLRIGRDG